MIASIGASAKASVQPKGRELQRPVTAATAVKGIGSLLDCIVRVTVG